MLPYINMYLQYELLSRKLWLQYSLLTNLESTTRANNLKKISTNIIGILRLVRALYTI